MDVIHSLYRGSAVLCVTAVLVFCGASSSFAQSSDVFNRLDRLEREIDTLNRALYKGIKPPVDTTSGVVRSGGADSAYRADLEVRLSALEEQIRSLTGKVEEQGYAIDNGTRSLERKMSDMEMRLSAVEQKAVISSAPAKVPAVPYNTQPQVRAEPVAPPASIIPQPTQTSSSQTLGQMDTKPDPNSSTGLYETAFSMLKAGNYDAAQSNFDTFLKTYPNNPLVENAQYWLGETYYVRNNYDQAARLFAQGYQKFPKGKKAADNLLKLGMSLAGMGNTEDACVALRQLKKDFSDTSSTPVVRRAEQEMLRLKCP